MSAIHAARTLKAPQDTAVGCRRRAEADLLASESMLTANERARMQISAASWTAGANFLERNEHSMQEKKKAIAEQRMLGVNS